MLKSFTKRRSVLYALLFTGIVFFCLPSQVQALQVANYPGFLNIQENMSLTALVSSLFAFLLAIAGIAAFVMIVFGGVKYLASAGDPSKMKDAKDQIFAAILGLIILFSSWMILNTINPNLVELREPGESPLLGSVAWGEIRTAGMCVEGEAYDVELWTKKNYSGERKCYNVGEEDEQLPLGQKIYSIKINGSAAVKLFDEPNFDGKNICFINSYHDLNLCGQTCGFWGCTEWYNNIESVKVTTGASCSYPNITLTWEGIPTEHEDERCD